MKLPKNPHAPAAVILAAAMLVSGCASSSISDARNAGLQNRQDGLNNLAESRAERRAIRSENADARSDALFDAM